MRKSTLYRFGRVVVCLGVFGCSSGGENAALGPDGKLTVAMIAKSAANPVFLSARVGAEDAARDLSKQYSVPVEVSWLTPDTEDARLQVQRVRQAVDQKADAILISASDAEQLRSAIDDAVGAGVQVMTFDSDVPGSRRFSFYGVDDGELGQRVMAELAKALGEKGQVAVLAGNPEAPNLQARVKGIQQEAAKYPGIQIVGVVHHPETADAAADSLLSVQRAHPGIVGWAAVGGWPLFSPKLMGQIDPAKVKIVAVDALPSELPYVESGLAPILLAQPTYMWGYTGVQTIVDKLVNDRKVPEIIRMAPVPVLRANLGYWARQLRDWGFKDVPAKYLVQ
jgi:ribose transport system substrate-binding protein